MTEDAEPNGSRGTGLFTPLRIAVVGLVGLAAGVAVGAGWFSSGQDELPAMPATAEQALRELPEPAEEDGWRRELAEPLDKPEARPH